MANIAPPAAPIAPPAAPIAPQPKLYDLQTLFLFGLSIAVAGFQILGSGEYHRSTLLRVESHLGSIATGCGVNKIPNHTSATSPSRPTEPDLPLPKFPVPILQDFIAILHEKNETITDELKIQEIKQDQMEETAQAYVAEYALYKNGTKTDLKDLFNLVFSFSYLSRDYQEIDAYVSQLTNDKEMLRQALDEAEKTLEGYGYTTGSSATKDRQHPGRTLSESESDKDLHDLTTKKGIQEFTQDTPIVMLIASIIILGLLFFCIRCKSPLWNQFFFLLGIYTTAGIILAIVIHYIPFYLVWWALKTALWYTLGLFGSALLTMLIIHICSVCQAIKSFYDSKIKPTLSSLGTWVSNTYNRIRNP